jgi:hypothetical protein
MKARDMAMSTLLGLGRHTVTGMITTAGEQYKDWSSTYRLFEQERIDKDELFAPILSEVCRNTDVETPVYAMMDDTLVRKSGHKIPGTQWRRDPLGPAFHTNFVWGQRFLQLSLAQPDADGSGRARAVPIDFIHAPGPIKPKKTAPPEDWTAYRQAQKLTKVSTLGAQRIEKMRGQVDTARTIVVSVDGGFTNSTVFKDVADNTVLIGRVRKDARLYASPPVEQPRRGRKRYYGEPLPTPEQIRQDESIPWQQVEAFAAGKRHTFDIKVMPSVRWKGTGDKDVSLVVIRPLAYRKTAGSKLLYRQPAYLLCTDTSLPLDQLLQAFLWRWEIEVNFRDEKTLLGLGQAQVTNLNAAQSVPSFIVAAYAFLLLAANAVGISLPLHILPKWRHNISTDRPSTQLLIALLRADLWKMGIASIKTHFASRSHPTRSPFYSHPSQSSPEPSRLSAVFFAQN